jgi:hypothetical protein
MLRQKKLAFIKSVSNIEFSPVFIREICKAVVTGRKALAVSKANDRSPTDLERQNRFGSEALTSRDSSQLTVSKRKAENFPAQTAL